MSHIARVSIEISDIVALAAAADTLGFEFHRGVTEYQSWTRSKPKCEHMLRLPGERYEVGVVRELNGKYTLSWDTDSHRINAALGYSYESPQAGRMQQAYAQEVAAKTMRRQGFRVQVNTTANGDVQLVCHK